MISRSWSSRGHPQPLRDGPRGGPRGSGGLPDRPDQRRLEQQIDLGLIGDRRSCAMPRSAPTPRWWRPGLPGRQVGCRPCGTARAAERHRGARSSVRAGETMVTGPQALLVSNDLRAERHRGAGPPCAAGCRDPRRRRGDGEKDTAGHRSSARRRRPRPNPAYRQRGRGGRRRTEIPVGIDGGTIMMPTPVRCTIQPKALRVRVPGTAPGPGRPA